MHGEPNLHTILQCDACVFFSCWNEFYYHEMPFFFKDFGSAFRSAKHDDHDESHTCRPGEKFCSDKSSSPLEGSWLSKSSLSSPLDVKFVVICPPVITDVVITDDIPDVKPGDVPLTLQSMFNSKTARKCLSLTPQSMFNSKTARKCLSDSFMELSFNIYHSLGYISRQQNRYFSYFSQKTWLDISCKLSPLETICTKCHILFCGKNMKNISAFCLLKILPCMLRNNKSTLAGHLVSPREREKSDKR